VLARGFAFLRCENPDCRERELVAFSRKGRGFCPSCLGRRMAESAANLVDHVLPRVPLRQFVLTLPFELRARLGFDAALLGAANRLFVDSVLGFYRRTLRDVRCNACYLLCMTAARVLPELDEDQHVILRSMSWQDYEALLAIRGDRSGVRMYYLDGDIELMSPAKIHENRKTTLARLLELWALETGVALNGFGSWTLKNELREAGAEPDECYIIGNADKDAPDLVIEVEGSRKTGLTKHEIYRRLGVRELWTLKSDGSLVIRVQAKDSWEERTKSKGLPKLDVAWLLGFLSIEPQSDAVIALRDALRRST
jgi:Uma2 family endonuclease